MSRNTLLAFLLLLALAVYDAPSQSYAAKSVSRGDEARVEDQIRDAIRQRLAALRREDASAYASFFAPECLVTSDAGAVGKPQDISSDWLTNAHAGVSYHGSDVLDLQVHSYAEIAVAVFRLELDEDWSGQKLLNSSRYTDVFVRRDGRWLLVAHQETPIPNARRVAAKIDPVLFDAYAGEYRLTPRYIVKVKHEGPNLMELWPGDSDFEADIPVDQSTFVSRGAAGEVIYVKTRKGKVTHLIYRTPAGDIIGAKVK